MEKKAASPEKTTSKVGIVIFLIAHFLNLVDDWDVFLPKCGCRLYVRFLV